MTRRVALALLIALGVGVLHQVCYWSLVVRAGIAVFMDESEPHTSSTPNQAAHMMYVVLDFPLGVLGPSGQDEGSLGLLVRGAFGAVFWMVITLAVWLLWFGRRERSAPVSDSGWPAGRG